MILFENRDELVNYYLKPSMKGAELGVFVGDFSRVLLTTQPRKLHLVDMFIGVQGSGDRDGNNMMYVDMNEALLHLKRIYANDERVVILQQSSQDFLMSCSDDLFDFVYIDADHSYDAVKADITIAFQKVKSGGYILGHDYVSPRFDGVVRAVNEFCASTGLSIHGLSKCGCPTYCIPVVK
jgi:hypothetical protein